MEFERTTHKQSIKLSVIRNEENLNVDSHSRKAFLEKCGLESADYRNFFHSCGKSDLFITDKTKWFLARIKYGI